MLWQKLMLKPDIVVHSSVFSSETEGLQVPGQLVQSHEMCFHKQSKNRKLMLSEDLIYFGLVWFSFCNFERWERGRERKWSWVGREEGKIWEEFKEDKTWSKYIVCESVLNNKKDT